MKILGTKRCRQCSHCHRGCGCVVVVVGLGLAGYFAFSFLHYAESKQERREVVAVWGAGVEHGLVYGPRWGCLPSSPSISAKRRALPRCVQRVSDDSTVVHISTSRSSPRQHEGQAAVHGAQPRPPPFASPHFHGLIGRSISPWRCSTCKRERDGAPNKSNSTIRPNLSFETLPPRESGVKPNPTSPLNSGTACPKSRPHIVPCENSTGGTTLDRRRSPLSPLCTRLILSALQDRVVQIFAIFEG